jgi:hypothetical protein
MTTDPNRASLWERFTEKFLESYKHILPVEYAEYYASKPFMTTDPKKRKEIPLASGCLDYFPDALAAVAHCSWVGNEQHNPGKPVHWDRSKSGDEAEALMRHFMERGKTDKDGVAHTAKVAWRALALLQKEIEAERASWLADKL